MANGKNKDNRDATGLKQEMAGIFLLAVALYIGVSLYSNNYASNWGGVIGVHLSGALLFSIGYVSYAFPFLLGIISFGLLLRRIFRFRPAVPICFAFFTVAASALSSELAGTKKAGGVIGTVLGHYLSNYLGSTGAIIILSAVALISILVATNISFVQTGMKAAPAAGLLFKSIASMAVGIIRRKDEEAEAEEPEARPSRKEKKAEKEERAKAEKPAIIKIHNRKAPEKEKEEEEDLEFTSPKGTFVLPPLSLLDAVPGKDNAVDEKGLVANSQVLEKKLRDFGIEGKVLEVRPGPVVTMYEFEPAPGVKVGRITNLSNDLALALKAMSIRIIAPIPGKSVVGIEVPNHSKEMILLREMLECPAFSKSRSRLSLALGKDISGNPYIADLARMPHLLVAGATGTGKSVSVNAMILSILYKATPEDARFLMIDPKMLELSAYEGIPHLITPVITDPKKAAGALKSIVNEMGRRYKLMSEKSTKNIDQFNRLVEDGKAGANEKGEEHKKLPLIVVIIDELADLMMTSGKDVEECLVRLSQMARASGIHLLIATQRPSVDVVTGLIKTNFPARIAFQLPSRTDSRTVLDAGGAETLLGEGDMLFLPPSTSKLQRIHGAFVSEPEIKKVTDFWKKQGSPLYDNAIIEEAEEQDLIDEDSDLGEEFLRRYDEAVAMAAELEMISTSYIQRRFRIGYNTAARIIEKMEKEGVVGPSQGSRPREVLLRKGV
ncbi:MAG: DNA translocase FtsK 4TM domain-containing protein [Deltaproteobacteria bacterium]|nr:DNA translocase FtsK 4TM domain-containing protein [Deltaproteobacteria bacterium]